MKTSLKKKFFIGVLGIIELLSQLNVTQVTFAKVNSSFPDVKADYAHLPAIEYLKNLGIVSGYPDGNFRPEQTINRAEALKIISLARQKLALTEANSTKTISFPDVKKSDWFFSYVQKAFDLTVVEGYVDGTFKPANPITTSESVKVVLISLVKNFQSSKVDKAPFNDVKISDWFAPYLSYALGRQFINAFDDGSYGPNRKISRGEFAELVYRVEFSEENKQSKYPISQNWPYCNNYQQDYKVKFPPNWTKIAAGDQMIFWKKDSSNSQISFARIYPDSAVVIISIDDNPNKLALETYINTLEYGQGAKKQVLTLNGMPYASVFLPESGLQDSYFVLPNGKILAIYAQVGDGEMSTKLKEEIRYLIGSIRESKTASTDLTENCLDEATDASLSSLDASSVINSGSNISPKEKLISDVLKKVLLQGEAQNVLTGLSDEILLETDTIGIGTGPVDYYYTEALGITLKIERNTSTILATKSGKTSAF